MSLITSVVFDLGNVLIDWDPRYLYRKLITTKTEVEWVLENICDEKWNAKHDAGYPFSDGIAEHSKKFPQYSELIRAWFSRWEEMLGDPLEEVVEVLSTLNQVGFHYTSSATGQQKLIQLRKHDSISCTGLTEKSFPAKPE